MTVRHEYASMSDARPPVALRAPQRAALDALEEGLAAGRRRAWVVLPPGLGKTLTGLEAARRIGRRTLVLGPNTAIQEQWCREWAAFRPAPVPAATDRSLTAPFTVLTYQALAAFEPGAESAQEDGAAPPAPGKPARRHLDRLRPQGRELVERLRAAGELTLVLDECHHLLDTWGELLAELLRELPGVTVVGLTATPPDRLTPAQAALVAELFGPAVRGPSLPAAVRDGYLAPYGELAWLTRPTPAETDWLNAQAERFTELTTRLTDPAFASVPFLTWLDERVVRRAHADTGATALPWHRFEREHPGTAAAALRLHHHGLLALPRGARLREEHRHPPDADDWVSLLDDWIRHCLRRSGEPGDARAVEAVRAALPGVGYRLTAAGVRAGRSPVDRVLARSAAKTRAVPEILGAESAALGPRLRALVVCDHESATATLPAGLEAALDAQAGSARLALAELAGDPRTAQLSPMLVSGRAVAAAPDTAERFARFCREAVPGLRVRPEPLDGSDGALMELVGAWSGRRRVRLVTRFLESGGTHVLVGTRALLGEGWDARGVNTLIDLSEATTATAVVQTRGRALRLDPQWPDKTAHTWSVVCVAPDHPRGGTDWDRFVRKHEGHLGVTGTGDILSGVAHVHPGLSPYAPPPAEEFDRFNAGMLDRVGTGRADVRALWRVGTAYEDTLVPTVRVVGTALPPQPPAPPGDSPAAAGAPPAVPAARGLVPRPRLGTATPAATAAAALLAGPTGAVAASGPGAGLWAAASAVLAGAAAYLTGRTTAGVRRLRATAARPVLSALAYAVADGLRATGHLPAGAEAVRIDPDGTGAYAVRLDGVPSDAAEHFATALDEVLSPLADPRYLLPRYVVHAAGPGAGFRARGRRPVANSVVHHAVPALVGGNRASVDTYATAWHRWVSAGAPCYTRSPEGAGLRAAQAGASPLDAGTQLRLAWR